MDDLQIEIMAKAASVPMGQDVVRVMSMAVSCDGTSEDDPLGHPLVYLKMGEEGRIACPYCCRQFVFVENFEFEG